MRSRGQPLSRDFDVEGGQQSPGTSPQNVTSPKRERRPIRGRKQSAIRLLKQAFKVKLRRYRRVLGRRNSKDTWRIFVVMGASAVLGFLVLNLVLYWKVESMEVTDSRFHGRVLTKPTAIKLSFVPATEAFNLPYGDLPEFKEGEEFDFGELFIDFFEEEDIKRQIYHNFTDEDTEYRLPDQSLDDDLDGYVLVTISFAY